MALNEIMFEHVPRNRCHREVRIGGRVSKVKVLVILARAITLSGVNRVGDGSQIQPVVMLTVVKRPPERISVIARAMLGFSATQRTRGIRNEVSR